MNRAEHVATSLDGLRRLIRVLRVGARHAEARSGLRPAQLFVLAQIADAPNQSIGELAACTLTDRTSVAAMIHRLASRGLVERVRGAEDRRRWEIRLTVAGRRTLDRAPSSPAQELLGAIERLEDSALVALSAGVDALVRTMQATHAPATMLFEDATPIVARRSGRTRA